MNSLAGICHSRPCKTATKAVAIGSGGTAALTATVALVCLNLIVGAYLFSWVGLSTGVSSAGIANLLMVAKWSGIAAGAATGLLLLSGGTKIFCQGEKSRSIGEAKKRHFEFGNHR